MKTCNRCLRHKSKSEFAPAKAYRGGLNAQCRSCRRKTANESYRRRRKVVAVKRRARYYADHEMSKAKALDYHYVYRLERGMPLAPLYGTDDERRAAVRANQRRYAARHPERVKAALVNARVRIRTGGTGRITESQWARILLFYGHRCGQCRKKRPLTVDHYKSTKHGGPNTWQNIWPLCLSCNLKKGEKILPGQPPHVVKLRKVI
jgi:5-methylcytosine-specific restriction endonuclease McrA